MFMYYARMGEKNDIIQTPKIAHIATILCPPLYIAQRKAWHCGNGTRNGVKTNPMIVAGTHNCTYRCAEM